MPSAAAPQRGIYKPSQGYPWMAKGEQATSKNSGGREESGAATAAAAPQPQAAMAPGAMIRTSSAGMTAKPTAERDSRGPPPTPEELAHCKNSGWNEK